MGNSVYGYVRVSSKDQRIDRQMEAMKAQGIAREKIYIDKMSGKDFERPNYKKMLKKLAPGDVLYIKSIDRLGRNYEEIIKQWQILTRAKGIDIVVIDFPLLDTRNKVNGITGKFLSDLVLQILSYVAEIERSNIHQRQEEGIRTARAKGVRFGRPRLAIPQEFPEIYEMWKADEISLRKAAQKMGTNHHTVKKWFIMQEKGEIRQIYTKDKK